MRSSRGGYESGPDSPQHVKPPTDKGRVATARPCSDKPGRRDPDGHGWVGTLLGWPWTWRCVYCRARRRGEARPDSWVTS